MKNQYEMAEGEKQEAGINTLPRDMKEALEIFKQSTYMKELWDRYHNKFQYASDLSWDTVMDAVRGLCVKAGLAVEPPKDISLIKQAPKGKPHGVPER